METTASAHYRTRALRVSRLPRKGWLWIASIAAALGSAAGDRAIASGSFPAPLERRPDVGQEQVFAQRAQALADKPGWGPAPAGHAGGCVPERRDASKVGWCLTGTWRNDTAPFLYGDTYVIHIFVDDNQGSWVNSSLNPFEPTRDTAAHAVREATEWIQHQAPWNGLVSFNTSNTDDYHFYNATISEHFGFDEFGLMTTTVPQAIGFTDVDADGQTLDDLLEGVRTLDGGGWENVIAVFHLRSADRSYAYDGLAATACFNSPSSGTFAHEIMHLYGASDEYTENGKCGGDTCWAPFRSPWIEMDYPNGNCELCSGHVDCVMIHDDIGPWGIGGSLCDFTRWHVGWGHDGGSDETDLMESRPWVELTTASPTAPTNDPSVVVTGTAYCAYRWTQTWAEYRVNGGSWLPATPVDGAWDSFQEDFWVSTDVPREGLNTLEFRALTSNLQVQNCPSPSYRVTLDTRGADPPYVASTSHPASSTYYADRSVDVEWYEPWDPSGIDGYSVRLAQDDAQPDDDLDDPEDVLTTVWHHYERTYTVAADGVWHLRVRAADVLSNWGTDTSDLEFRVDTTPPSVPTISSTTHPDPEITSNLATASFQWSSDDAHSGISGYAWGLDEDPDGTATTSFWQYRTSANVPVPVWPPGSYYFHVAARDNVGNWSAFATYEIRADRSAPILTVASTSHPDGGTWSTQDDATFSWSLVNAETVPGYSYTHALVGPTPADPDTQIDTPATSVTLWDLASGEYWFGVRAKDPAGNWGPTAWTSLRIDATDPTLVSNLYSASHSRAIGQRDCQQSGDRTVSVNWVAATDAHSGLTAYEIGWNQEANVFPPQPATIGLLTYATSSDLPDGDWYFHVRATDVAGNVDDEFATLGPIHIEGTPPPAPGNVVATSGNATVTVQWDAVPNEGPVTYDVYRRLQGGSFGAAVATDLQATSYTDDWPSILNGDLYDYAVTTQDACGLESDKSYAALGAPEYTSPGNGSSFTVVGLVAVSKGGTRGTAPNFTLHGNVTIAATDRLDVAPGQRLTSQDRTGTKKLQILGTLVAPGTPVAPIVFDAANPSPGSWGGLDLAGPGGLSSLQSCTVRYATTGIIWIAGSPSITSCTVERCSAGGIATSPGQGLVCTVQSNTVRWCGGTGIFVFGTPNSTTNVTANQVTENGAGIAYSVDPGQAAPALLSIATNQVLRQTGDGIVCGKGALNVTVNNNTVLENENGIVFNSYGQLGGASPVVHSNDVSGNRNAGVYTSVLATPIVRDNNIVQNGAYGLYSRTDAGPTCYRNVITGSRYGVFVEASPVRVPDLGAGTPASPGQNRLDGHTILWMRNDTAVALSAKGNWWGAAQPPPVPPGLPPTYNGLPATSGPVTWNPVWMPPAGNVVPSITLTSPNGGTALDAVTVTWTDTDADDAARVNLYYDTDGADLDGTQIFGASNLSEDDETDTYTWDTSLVPAGTHFVYALISDDEATRSAYAPGSITVQHPAIVVAPGSLTASVPPGGLVQGSLVVRNTGTASLAATLSESAAWLALGATALAVAPGDSAVVAVGYDASLLDEGVYSTTLDVASDDHAQSQMALGVTLRVEKPEIDISASALDFGGIGVGTSGVFPLLVRNLGTAGLVVTGLSVTGTFTVAGAALPASVAPGATLALTVTYTPTGPSADMGTLDIASSDADEGSLQVVLSGTGLAPEARVAETAHTFGPVVVGATVTWSVLVANDGTSVLHLSGAVFDGPGFVLLSPSLASSVAPGDSLALTMGFVPAEPRDYTASLVLQTNDADESSVELVLHGLGTIPQAALAGGPVDFGTARLGVPVERTVHVRNTGGHGLQVTMAGAPDPFSVVAPALPAAVPPGDSLAVTLRFAPVALGPAGGTLSIATDAQTTATLQAPLAGTGVAPDAALVAPALDFGTVRADRTTTLGVVLRNEGSAVLTVTSLAVASARFAVDAPTLPSDVASGDSVVLDVSFVPAPVGAHADTLRIATDDPDEPVVTVALAARAELPEVAIVAILETTGSNNEEDVTATGYDFDGVVLLQPSERQLRVRNRGGYPLAVTAVSVAGADFTVEPPALPASVAPGAFLALPVSFRPTSTSPVAGLLTVATDDPETPALDIPLAGHGSDAVAAVSPGTLAATLFEGGALDLALRFTNAGERAYAYLVREEAGGQAAAAPPTQKTQLLSGGHGLVARAALPAKTAADIGWISLPDSSGWVAGGDTLDARIHLDAAPAGPGVHAATLLVLTSDAALDTTRIPVRLRVPRMRYADHSAAFQATVTDEGAFGFYDAAQQEIYGSGFVYPRLYGVNHLFHGSLWIGTSSTRVSDASYDSDFEVVPGGELSLGGTDPQRSTARYRDTGALQPLGIEVEQEGLSYAAPAEDDFLVLNYVVRNVSGGPLAGALIGLYLDWDIGAPRQNEGAYDAPRSVGYMFNRNQTDSSHVGIVMLNPPQPASFHLIHHPTLVYPYGTVRDEDKYALLADGIIDSATFEPEDWSMVMSAGPFDLAAGQAVHVSFAIVAGLGKQALLEHAAAVRARLATDAPPPAARLALAQNVPNPFNPTTRIDFEVPRAARTRLGVFDVRGRLVAALLDGPTAAGSHHVVWDGRDAGRRSVAAGVYFYRLHVEGERQLVRKMVLLE